MTPSRPPPSCSGPWAPGRAASGRSVWGTVNGRRFLFHVGIGFDAAVVAQVERRSAVKRYLGHAFFAYAALDTWARHYDRRHPHFSATLQRRNGESVTIDDGYFAICLKTNPYTFLGERPFNVAPGTGFDTPLSVVVLRSLGAVTLLGLAATALRGGEGFGRRRKVAVVDDVVEATFQPRGTVPYQVDGDYLGDTAYLRFGWAPDQLRLIVPGR